MEGAALVGYLEAARDYGIEAVAGLFDLAVLAGETVDFVVSELTVLLGIAGERRERMLNGSITGSSMNSPISTRAFPNLWRR